MLKLSMHPQCWNFMLALGNVAFAYSYSFILIEVCVSPCACAWNKLPAPWQHVKSITLALHLQTAVLSVILCRCKVARPGAHDLCLSPRMLCLVLIKQKRCVGVMKLTAVWWKRL